jgi:hypothetical protein
MTLCEVHSLYCYLLNESSYILFGSNTRNTANTYDQEILSSYTRVVGKQLHTLVPTRTYVSSYMHGKNQVQMLVPTGRKKLNIYKRIFKNKYIMIKKYNKNRIAHCHK